MLNELTIRKAVELELATHGPEHEEPPRHDLQATEHTPVEDAAFERALHKHTPFEAVEEKIAAELSEHKDQQAG